MFHFYDTFEEDECEIEDIPVWRQKYLFEQKHKLSYQIRMETSYAEEQSYDLSFEQKGQNRTGDAI